jgi:hypothetical protein
MQYMKGSKRITNKPDAASKRATIRDNSARLGEMYLNKARTFAGDQLEGEEEDK